MERIYWVSRHDLSPAQHRAVLDLHGEDIEVIKDPLMLEGLEGLTNYIIKHRDNGMVYAVAPTVNVVHAALANLTFGIFENHPGKRQDGQFGLKSVYHIGNRQIQIVWENSDPERDHGDLLIPTQRV